MKKSKSKYMKPYPKTYIFIAVFFTAFFMGIWSFFGVLYQKDMNMLGHCNIGILASSLSEYAAAEDVAEYNNIHLTYLKIADIAKDVEMSENEENYYTALTTKMTEFESKVKAVNESSDAVSLNSCFRDVHDLAHNLSSASKVTAEHNMESSKKSHLVGDYSMFAIFCVTLFAIIFVGHLVRKKESALAVEEENNKRLKSNVESAKEKVYKAAYSNLLYDCGNRFALEEEVAEKAQKNESYCLARFNMCSFDNLLSMFGYDKVDECLSDIAKSINEKFGDSGTLYAINDESLVFKFDKNSTINEVTGKAENIRATISNTLSDRLHVAIPVNGAILCTNHFRGKSGNSILVALHNAAMQSNPSAPLCVA